jgi:hypothetical protein
MRSLAVSLALVCTLFSCSHRDPGRAQDWRSGGFDTLGKYNGASIAIGHDGMLSVLLQDGNALAFVHCKDSKCEAFDVTRLPDIRQETQSAYLALPDVLLHDRKAGVITFLRCGDEACRSSREVLTKPFPYEVVEAGKTVWGAKLLSANGGTEFVTLQCNPSCVLQRTCGRLPAAPFMGVVAEEDLWSAIQPTGGAVSIYRCDRPVWTANDSAATVRGTASSGNAAWFALVQTDAIRLVRCAEASCEPRGVLQAANAKFLTTTGVPTPMLAFASEDTLYFARCADPECKSLGATTIGRGLPLSVAAAPDGTVWIAYTEPDADVYELAHCLDAGCSSVQTVSLPQPGLAAR